MNTLTLDAIDLKHGSHGAEFCGEACAVEVASLIAAGRVIVPAELLPPCPLEPAPFGDDHPSISPVIRGFVVSLNDAWNDEDRQRLKPYAARILCTRTTAEDEQTRAWMATDWLCRVHTPAFLRLAGLEDHARALEGLARIADATTARSAQPTLNAAREASAAAGDAAWDATRAAAGAAAWAAAGDAAWDATRAAAWDAARAAAGVAARAAAWDAAWDAARGALRTTVEHLQASALVLLDGMIAVGRPTGAPTEAPHPHPRGK